MDIEDGREKLRIVAELAQRMWDAASHPVKVYTALDRREALPEADFVTTQFRVGGLLKMGDKLSGQMLREFEEYHTNGFPVHFYKTELGSDSGLIGAVELLF